MQSNHLFLCCPLLLLPSIFPSIWVFSCEWVLHIVWPNVGASASTSVILVNIQDWFSLIWTGWILLLSKGLSRIFSNTTVQKHHFFDTQLFFIVQLSHPYMTTGKTIALTRWTFVGKVISLLFNMLSVLVTTSKEQASFNFMAAFTICSDFAAQENKVCHCFHCFPIYSPWSDGTGCHLSFLNVEF